MSEETTFNPFQRLLHSGFRTSLKLTPQNLIEKRSGEETRSKIVLKKEGLLVNLSKKDPKTYHFWKIQNGQKNPAYQNLFKVVQEEYNFAHIFSNLENRLPNTHVFLLQKTSSSKSLRPPFKFKKERSLKNIRSMQKSEKQLISRVEKVSREHPLVVGSQNSEFFQKQLIKEFSKIKFFQRELKNCSLSNHSRMFKFKAREAPSHLPPAEVLDPKQYERLRVQEL